MESNYKKAQYGHNSVVHNIHMVLTVTSKYMCMEVVSINPIQRGSSSLRLGQFNTTLVLEPFKTDLLIEINCLLSLACSINCLSTGEKNIRIPSKKLSAVSILFHFLHIFGLF